jgi:TonB family protein
MKLVLWLAAFAACSTVPGIAAAGQGLKEIEVSGSTAAAEWSDQVPHVFRPWEAPEGTVTVTFSRGADGRPRDIALFEQTGNRRLVRAAIDAVARLDAIPPLPGAARVVRANLIYAATEESLERQSAALRQKEAVRIARDRDSGHRVAVLTSAPSIGG